MINLTAIKTDEILKPFFRLNPNFDLEGFDFANSEAVDAFALNWQNLDKDTIIARLKAYQRLLPLGLSPDEAKQLLGASPTERDEGTGLLASSAPASAAPTGIFDSALAISSLSETEFIQASTLSLEKAKETHRQATEKTAGSMVLLANTLQFGAPRHQNMLASNTKPLHQQLLKIPSYQKLFDSLDYLQCDPCQSIFSPAAYFVDLMRIVDRYITQPNKPDKQDENKSFESLQQRRPDLEQIPLTCDNTNDTVFYTEIVKEVLTEKLKHEVGEDIFRHLATAKYPRHLPFNLYLEQIRLYLGHLGTNLADIYQTYHPDNPYTVIWAQEYLGLSSEEYQLITTAKTDDLSDRYGVDISSSNLGGLEKKDVFLKQTGLSWQELNDLLYQNLSPKEIKEGVAHQFYINGSLSDNKFINLHDGSIENLDLGTLDRCDRFLRLARKLDWSFADLDWVLTSIKAEDINEDAIVKIAQIKHLQAKTKLPLDVLCSFWHDMKTIGKGDKENRPQDLCDRIFNNHFTALGQEWWEITADKGKEWKIDSTDEGDLVIRKRLLAALQLSDRDLTDMVEEIWSEQKEVTLNLTNLSILYRHALMLKLLGLKAKEYQLVLKFGSKSLENIEKLEIDTLIEILELAQWLKVSGFSVYELDYILNGIEYPFIEVFLPKEKMAASMKSLWEKVKLPKHKLVKELNEEIANHFGITTGLLSILATLVTEFTQEKDRATKDNTDKSKILSFVDFLVKILTKDSDKKDYTELLLTKVEIKDDDPGWQKMVQCLQFISKMLFVANKLALTEVELRNITEHPQAYNIDSLNQLTFKNIQTLYKFKQHLIGSFNQPEEKLLDYLKTSHVSDESSILAVLTKLTGWNQKQIKAAIEYFKKTKSTPDSSQEGKSYYDSVEGLLILKQCFDLSATLGCNIDFLHELCDLLENNSEADNWTTYQNLAQSVTSLVKAKYDDEEWTKVFGKLNGTLSERKCHVLTDFALHQLGMDNLRQLSEYLLLDVEMTSCACNSPIQLAILSVQTYLQRCRMGLEEGVSNVEIPEMWWEWIMNYRKWEANRKVFLYPENYIDPSLRKDASPIFKELQDELLQSEITAESVETAYRNYFDKFAEIARLQIVEGCRYSVKSPKNPDPIDTLFLFAKTITEPRTFYYRRCENPEAEKPLWGYWQKIDLQINSDYLASVYAFNRLFIFWVETKEIKKSQDTEITQATVKYSFLNASQKWVSPQTLVADVEVSNILPMASNEDKKTFWQQVLPYRVKNNSTETEDSINIIWGGLPTISSTEYDEKKLSLISKLNFNWAKRMGSDLLPVPVTLTKETVQDKLSEARFGFAASNVDNLVVFAGGLRYERNENIDHDSTPQTTTDIVDVFVHQDGELKKLTSNLKLSEARFALAASTVGNLVVFAGGQKKDKTSSDKIDIFAYKNGQLEKVDTNLILSEARLGLAASTVGNLVVFAGGWAENYSNKIDIFAYKNGQLEKVDTNLTLSEARNSLAGSTVGNLVVFAGGEKENKKPSDKIDIFAYKNGQLEKVDTNLTLSEARNNLAASTVGNLVMFAGGKKENKDSSDKIDIFAYKNGQLEEVDTNLTLSEARYSLAASIVGNLVVFAGGRINQNSSSKRVDVFAYHNGQLKEQKTDLELSQPQYLKAVSTVANLVVFAGGKTFNQHYDNVEVFAVTEPTLPILPSDLSLPTNTNIKPIQANKTPVSSLIFQRQSQAVSYLGETFPLTRLTTSTIQQFSDTLFAKGLDGLLSLESQQIKEPDFPGVTNNQLDFDGAYGAYFWEIFFHIPFLIASTLNAHQRYNEARQWYQYIFNPGQSFPHLPKPIAFLPLNDNHNTIKDESGPRGTTLHNGTWKTVTDFPGSNSRSVLCFDGQSTSVEIETASSLELTDSSFTVEAWVKADEIPGIGVNDAKRDLPIFCTDQPKNGGSLENECLQLLIRYDTAFMGFWNNDLPGKQKLEKDVWYQIVWRYDQKTHEQAIFINGLLDASRTGASAFVGTGNAYIGRFLDSHFFQGQIANVRIWNRPLSNQEIFESFDSKNYFWRFLPFRGHTLEKLKEILTNTAAIQAYKENPFDPHAIARLRIGAYEKAVVMKYIDNLLDWGDALFTQDNWESITQATTLYLLAYDLLGEKPKNQGLPPAREPKTFAEIKAGATGDMAEFLIDLENPPEYREFIKQFGDAVPFNALDAYFCISENQEFAQYWDRVEDRLFKIRHCQNIKGIERQLALFSPPIDPKQLVRQAAAADGSITLPTTDQIPNYRFSYLLERAKGMVSTVIQLGSTLLNTLEKKDAEELAVLRATQEPILLQLITKTKEKQIEEAEANLVALQQSKKAAKSRSHHYESLLINGHTNSNGSSIIEGGVEVLDKLANSGQKVVGYNLGLNAGESASILLMGAATAFQVKANFIRGGSGVLYLLPKIVGTSVGGSQPGEATDSAATILDSSAGILNHGASIASTIAQYQRRKEDWELQKNMADWDTQQIEAQIEAAKVRIDLAKAELDVHHKSIEHSRQVEQFYKDKFTNKDLYQWMVGRLSSLYFQTYKIALDMANSAQKAYHYELNKDDTYIQSTYWDSNKKGLLAGESLMLGLNQLEKAYLDGNTRRLEIEKIISLRQLDRDAFFNLIQSGSCTFNFDEKLFALDFPSHYCRQIKTISVSIPAVVGPYQNINATLTQTSNKVLIKPDTNAVEWLLGVEKATKPDTGILRQDWRQNQQIAISKGTNDSGLFVLNFQDERYLPFEGTGVISSWELELPRASNAINFASITDVIITVSYTALEGGSTIRKAVTKNFENFHGKAVRNLKPELLQNSDPKSLSFTVSPNLFRTNLSQYKLSKVSLVLLVSQGDLPNTLNLKITDGGKEIELKKCENKDKECISYKSQGELSESPQQYDPSAPTWSLHSKDELFDSKKVTELILIVDYEGGLNWNS